MTTPRNRDAERRAARLMRVAVLAWYGEVCACCGTTGDLTVDHVNGDGPAQREAAWGQPNRDGYNPARLLRWIIEHGFPDGFATLCKPCNASKAGGDRCGLYHGPPLADSQKWCTGCQQVKDRSAFFRNRRRKDGLNAHCQECSKRHVTAWRTRHGTHRSVSVREGTIGGRVLAYLGEHGSATSADLTRFLGITPASVAVNLSGLVQAGHVARPAPGVFCLPGREGDVTRVRHVYERGPDWAARHEGKETAGKDWTAGMTWRAEVVREADGTALR